MYGGRATVSWRVALPWVLVVLGLAVGYSLLRTRNNSGAGGLRGGAILNIHLPTMPPESIEVFADGHVSRGRVLPKPQRSFINLQLPVAQWEGANAVRARWCRETPAFRSLRADEAVYAIELSCGPGFAKHVEVPGDQLPPELATLLTSVPSPP
jgi:hypothetical protein